MSPYRKHSPKTNIYTIHHVIYSQTHKHALKKKYNLILLSQFQLPRLQHSFINSSEKGNDGNIGKLLKKLKGKLTEKLNNLK